MSRSAQKQIQPTKHIRFPNIYIQALYKNYKDWAFDELLAPLFKGKWRSQAFFNTSAPLHLEIGPGNGKHFAQLCLKQKNDCCLSVELKYKPLIQTISRVKKNNSQNGRVARYNARWVTDLFEPQELNNVYIHFPDPWLKKNRQTKHQLIQADFCKTLYQLQKPLSFLEFKTDSEDYFHQSLKRFKQAGYKLKKQSLNLYKNLEQSSCLIKNFSQFELLFFQKKHPIKYAHLIKD